MKRVFADCHPVINLAYFTAVLVFAMWFMHPAALILSLICAAVNVRLLCRQGGKWLFLLPMLLLAAILNPLFNHEGMTILIYLPDGNPLTKEAILYGCAAAVMLGAVILWFASVNAVLTSDKLIYLFGRIVPGFSLLLSMILRFVPRFRQQLSRMRQAAVCMGEEAQAGNLLTRAKRGMTMLSGLATWSLETAVATADSMKSRGYGLPGRSSFAVYRMTKRDICLLVWIVFCTANVVFSHLRGGFAWKYYPRISTTIGNAATVWGLAAYAGLCLTPLAVEIWEAAQWRISKSGI